MTVAELRKYLDGYPDDHVVMVDMGSLGNPGQDQFQPAVVTRMSYRRPWMVIEL